MRVGVSTSLRVVDCAPPEPTALPAAPKQVHNEGGSKRVLVTKELPGSRWLDVLVRNDCRVEICTDPAVILPNSTIKQLIGDKCDGVVASSQRTGRTSSSAH
eukprot:jgi/Tetstr1/429341/TSEL_019259.t1